MAAAHPPLDSRPKAGRHAPLISLLTTFYNLLVDLRTFPPRELQLGPHPPDSVDVVAAAEWRFTDPEALDLLYQLPYIVSDSNHDHRLLYETSPLCYLGQCGDLAFEIARDPNYQKRMDLIPPHIINLTHAHNMGENLLYDVRARTITSWDHFGSKRDDYLDCTFRKMGDPDNALVKWIKAYLSLQWVPDDMNWHHPITSLEKGMDEPMEQDVALKKVFVESGWDIKVLPDRIVDDEDGALLARAFEEARLAATRDFDIQIYRTKKKMRYRKYDAGNFRGKDEYESDNERVSTSRARKATGN